MIRIYLSVTALLWTTLMTAQNTMTWYAPMNGQLQVDTTIWKVAYMHPTFLNWAMHNAEVDRMWSIASKDNVIQIGFSNQFDELSSEFISSWSRRIEMTKRDTILNLPEFSCAAQRKGQLYFYRSINDHSGFVISTNVLKHEAEKIEQLKQLFQSFVWVEPSAIDLAAGYPLPKKASYKEDRERIIREIYPLIQDAGSADAYKLKAVPLDTVWFDQEIFYEKKLGFSFQRFVNEYEKLYSESFTKEDLYSHFFEKGPDQFAVLFGRVDQLRPRQLYKFIDVKGGKPFYTDQCLNDAFAVLNNDSVYKWIMPIGRVDGHFNVNEIEGKRALYKNISPISGSTINAYSSFDFFMNASSTAYATMYEYKLKKNEKQAYFESIPEVTVVPCPGTSGKSFKLEALTLDQKYDWIYIAVPANDSTEHCGVNGASEKLFGDGFEPYGNEYGNFTLRELHTLGFDNATTSKGIAEYDYRKMIPMTKRLLISDLIEEDITKDKSNELIRVCISNGVIVKWEIWTKSSKGGLRKVGNTEEGWLTKLKASQKIQTLMNLSKDEYMWGYKLVVEEVSLEERYWDVVAEPMEDIATVPVEIREEEEVVSFAEVMPEYPGGNDALMAEIASSLVYPEIEKMNEIQGSVYLGFVVELDGKISDIRVMRGVKGGPGLDKEAIRVVKGLKHSFSPAKMNGRPVRLQYYLPIRFSLE
ncbi:MAG: energy transducer TonB [Flavobacteriales bacterium]